MFEPSDINVVYQVRYRTWEGLFHLSAIENSIAIKAPTPHDAATKLHCKVMDAEVCSVTCIGHLIE
jgi:hypothetical protein